MGSIGVEGKWQGLWSFEKGKGDHKGLMDFGGDY